MGIDQFPVSHINGTPKALDVDVAVLDSGIDPHPDLNVHQFFSPFSNDGNDEVGHGTEVAGIVGAMDNGFGVAGAAPGVRLWNVKCIGPPPNNAWVNVLSGMEYVLERSNQISVANMSIVNEGADAPIGTVRGMLRLMVSAGIVVVASAGNATNDLAGMDGIYGTGDDAVPAALPQAMAVSAMQPVTDTLWPFSNFSQIERTNGYTIGGSKETNYVFSSGGAMDVAAPGTSILTTTTNGGYRLFSGTSAAAPHVAGLVALYIAANGRATNAEGVYRIRQAIIDASLPQSQWNTTNTLDPDTNPEPLAIASENWVPLPLITNPAGALGNFQLGFNAVPGYGYTVQSADNLTPPIAWTNVATVTGSNFVTSVSVTDSHAADQQIYRLSRSPSP